MNASLPLPMPAPPTGLQIATHRLPFAAPALPPDGTTACGRLVIVGMLSPCACRFGLRHAFISADLGLATGPGPALCGSVRIGDGYADVSVLLRHQHALVAGLLMSFGLAMSLCLPALLGVPLSAGWIACNVVVLRRASLAVARDAVWALELAARGESPWRQET